MWIEIALWTIVVIMAGTLHLGTSGFAYEEWRHGVFYPEGVSASRMLSHYASVFESVEIIYTFRRFPSEATLRTWLSQTPETFRFALKAGISAGLKVASIQFRTAARRASSSRARATPGTRIR